MKKLILGVVFFAMSLQVGGGALYAAAEQKEQVGDTSSYFDQFVQAVGNKAKAAKKELSFLWGYLLKKYIHGEKTTQKEDERAKRIQKKIGIAIGALVATVATVIGFTWYKSHLKEAEAIKKVNELVKKNEINVKDPQGNTPLYNAVQQRNFIMARLLIDKGAVIDCKDDDNFTPLHEAVLGKNIEMARLLIDHDADVNLCDTYGATPLHTAVLNQEVELVKLLIDHDADKNIKDNDGKTPLDIAQKMKNSPTLNNEKKNRSDAIIKILSSPSNKK